MKPTVLIVEDEPEMREALKHVLRAEYDVVACRDGQEALDRLDCKEKCVDLVITDIRMPSMSGYELITKIQERTPAPPIIAMSVYFDDDPELTAEIKKRVGRLVRKPLDLMELKRSVDELVQRKKNGQDRRQEAVDTKNCKTSDKTSEMGENEDQIFERSGVGCFSSLLHAGLLY